MWNQRTWLREPVLCLWWCYMDGQAPSMSFMVSSPCLRSHPVLMTLPSKSFVPQYLVMVSQRLHVRKVTGKQSNPTDILLFQTHIDSSVNIFCVAFFEHLVFFAQVLTVYVQHTYSINWWRGLVLTSTMFREETGDHLLPLIWPSWSPSMYGSRLLIYLIGAFMSPPGSSYLQIGNYNIRSIQFSAI